MTITDEHLSAYIDGELATDEMERVRRTLDRDDALAVRLANLKRMDQVISTAYGGIDDEPMPEAVLSLLASQTSTPNTNRHSHNVFSFSGHNLRIPPQWRAPLAATAALAIGVGVGVQLPSGPNNNQGALMIAGAIDKSSPLHAALENVPSTQSVAFNPASDSKIVPILTFISADGNFCREFKMLSSTGGQHGVACRLDERWVVQFAAAIKPEATGAGYSTASSNVTIQFDALIDTLIGEAPLDADEEAAILNSQWRLEK